MAAAVALDAAVLELEVPPHPLIRIPFEEIERLEVQGMSIDRSYKASKMPHLPDWETLTLKAVGRASHPILSTGLYLLMGWVIVIAADPLLARVPTPRFPGGTLLRRPALIAGMLYYGLRDRF